MTFPAPERFLPNGLLRTVTVSSSPVTELVPALDELLGFPYGCAEQTTSKAMPMLYASALLDGGKADFAEESVRAGIRRLELMQTIRAVCLIGREERILTSGRLVTLRVF